MSFPHDYPLGRSSVYIRNNDLDLTDVIRLSSRERRAIRDLSLTQACIRLCPFQIFNHLVSKFTDFANPRWIHNNLITKAILSPASRMVHRRLHPHQSPQTNPLGLRLGRA